MHPDLPQLPSLQGKRLVLGITGGIAAYKSAELVRLLSKQNMQVQVVMTPAACKFITPLTFQALSGLPVHLSQWPEDDAARGMPHIDLSRQADAILVAPCTANSIAKYANGLAENLLDNLILARNCPVALAPAMNVEMWNNPATQRNLQQVQADGIQLFGPAIGLQACGEVGAGRLLEPEELVFELARMLSPKPLHNQRVLLTAGPTFEAIDPVRGITNRSSGKMGYAMAQAAWLMGAQVKLVSGPSSQTQPYGVELINVESAKDMHQTVMAHIEDQSFFIGVAAVADYGIKNPSTHKQKKQDKPSDAAGLNIEFELNPDILACVGQWVQSNGKSTKVVGFAAETQNLDEYASKKLVTKKAHAILGNLAQNTLGSDEVELTLYSPNRQPFKLSQQTKLSAATQALELINQLT